VEDVEANNQEIIMKNIKVTAKVHQMLLAIAKSKKMKSVEELLNWYVLNN